MLTLCRTISLRTLCLILYRAASLGTLCLTLCRTVPLRTLCLILYRAASLGTLLLTLCRTVPLLAPLTVSGFAVP